MNKYFLPEFSKGSGAEHFVHFSTSPLVNSIDNPCKLAFCKLHLQGKVVALLLSICMEYCIASNKRPGAYYFSKLWVGRLF